MLIIWGTQKQYDNLEDGDSYGDGDDDVSASGGSNDEQEVDSSDEGGTHFITCYGEAALTLFDSELTRFDQQTIKRKQIRTTEPIPAARAPVPVQPRLVVERNEAGSATSSTTLKTLGQRASSSKSGVKETPSASGTAVVDGGILRNVAGGMEFTFNPLTSSQKSPEERRATLAKSKAKRSIVGVGMQRGDDVRSQDEVRLTGEAAQGRKRRRQIERSASKTKMRKTLGQ